MAVKGKALKRLFLAGLLIIAAFFMLFTNVRTGHCSYPRGTFRVAPASSGYADYTTISAAIAGLSATLTEDVLILVDPGTYTESSTISITNDLGGYSLTICPVTWPVGSIAENNSAIISSSVSSNPLFTINLAAASTGTLTIEGLTLVDGGSTTYMISTTGTTAATINLRRNVIKGGTVGIRNDSASAVLYIYNNTIYNCSSRGIGFDSSRTADTGVVGNTIVDVTHASNTTYGIDLNAITVTAINNLVVNCRSNSGLDFYDIAQSVGFNNACDDTSCANANWLADGTYTSLMTNDSSPLNLTPSTASTHYDDIDDAVASPNNDDYVHNDSDSTNMDFDYFYNSVDPTGAQRYALITSVVVKARCNGTEATTWASIGTYRIGVYNGTDYNETESANLLNAWTLYTRTLTTEPFSGSSNTWTWADIDILQIGIGLKSAASGYATYIRCSQIYYEVNYDANGGNKTSATINTSDFNSYGTDDFSLEAGSDCINSGYNAYGKYTKYEGSLRGRRLRSTSDIGAFEYYISATNRYFSQSGNDSTGDGTSGTPWKTIAKLNDLDSTEVLPGAIIYLDSGDTWNVGDTGEETLMLTGCTDGGGLAGSEITINGIDWTVDSGTRAKLNDTGFNWTDCMIKIVGKDHIKIVGVNAVGGDCGISLDGTWNCTVDNCESSYHTDTAYGAISIGGTPRPRNTSILNTAIHDGALLGIAAKATVDNATATGGAFITGCTIYDLSGFESFGIKGADAWVISNNTIYNVKYCVNQQWTPATIRYNYLHDFAANGSGVRLICPRADIRHKARVYGNLIQDAGGSYGISMWDCETTAEFYYFNNTILMGDYATAAFFHYNCETSTLVMRNNIIYSLGSCVYKSDENNTDHVTSNYNSFYQSDPPNNYFAQLTSNNKSWTEWKAYGHDANSLGSLQDPSFVNNGGSNDYDYKLTAASALRNTGTSIVAFDGVNTIPNDYFDSVIPAAVDIGFYEYPTTIPIILHHRRLSQ